MNIDIGELSERQARLEGVIEQLDRRLTNIEQGQRDLANRMDTLANRMESELRDLRMGQRWIIGLLFTSWLTTVGLILYKLSG